MAEDKETRDRVRELVRQVLESVPTEDEPPPEIFPKRVVVNSLSDKIDKEFDRDESAKSLITEDDLRGLGFGAKLRISENAKFTPLASDIIQEKNIVLIKKSSRHSSAKVQSVAIGADHGGFGFKEQLKDFLAESGLQVRDFGTNSTDAVDYPDFAHAVAKAVGEKQVDVGIIIDGAGIGSAMTANKVPNVRAAACYSAALAKNSREHNGANVLTLGSGQNNFNEIKEIVEAFLSTDLTEDRHKKRVGKIDNIESNTKDDKISDTHEVKIMENVTAEISTQIIPPIISSSKMTYEEFLREYDGQYAEYVEGEIIKPMSVTQRHDDLTLFLQALLRLYVEAKKLGKIHGEPYQMKMGLGDKIKGREPDIFFVKTENLARIGEQFFDGAADLVIEVISPESITRDTVDKFEEYEAAGIQEYWIINPNQRTANFYGYDENGKYKLLHLSAEGIFESRVIEGLWINTDWLWQEELPNLMDVLKDWKLI